MYFFVQIGTYNPIPSKDQIKEVTADSDRLKYWISCGAQMSDRVKFLFGKVGLLPPAPLRKSMKYMDSTREAQKSNS